MVYDVGKKQHAVNLFYCTFVILCFCIFLLFFILIFNFCDYVKVFSFLVGVV